MKIIFLLFIGLIIVSCSDNKRGSSQPELRENAEEFENSSFENGMICVDKSFSPSLNLDDKRLSMPFDSLYRIEIEKHNVEGNPGENMALARAGKVLQPVSVPKESKLAKAFLIESFWLFMSQNESYVDISVH